MGPQQRRLIAAGRICDGEMTLALLTPAGLPVLRLRYTGGRIEVMHRRGLPRGLTARAILADFQLVHWPADALRAAWGEAWSLRVTPGTRVALYRGEPRVRVAYGDGRWQGPVTLVHLRSGYRLSTTPLAGGMTGVACAPGAAP